MLKSGMPSANTRLTNMWQMNAYEKHMEKLQNVKGSVVTRAKTQKKPMKVTKYQANRNMEIERENRILLQKMHQIQIRTKKTGGLVPNTMKKANSIPNKTRLPPLKHTQQYMVD